MASDGRLSVLSNLLFQHAVARELHGDKSYTHTHKFEFIPYPSPQRPIPNNPAVVLLHCFIVCLFLSSGPTQYISHSFLTPLTRLYEALVLSTLLNSADLWPFSVTQMEKKLEAAHHRWQRSIVGISWKYKVTNEKVREATALPKLKDIIRCRRLRLLGHLSRMDHYRLPQQALTWETEDFRRRPGRPRQNWKDVVKKDPRKMGIS